MEFDKNKILTVVTANRLTQGQMGWINDYVEYLKSDIKNNSPYKVFRATGNMCFDFPFEAEYMGVRRYFYPAPEPTYEERQAEWVKENNVKAGTKVRVTRMFTEDEDGSCCWAHADLVGMIGSVSNIGSGNLRVDMTDGYPRVLPYFALEVIKEPTYRPFKNAEEFKPYRDEWFRVKNGGGFDSVRYYDNDGVKDSTGNFITYQKLFEVGERENGEPCGVREEA